METLFNYYIPNALLVEEFMRLSSSEMELTVFEKSLGSMEDLLIFLGEMLYAEKYKFTNGSPIYSFLNNSTLDPSWRDKILKIENNLWERYEIYLSMSDGVYEDHFLGYFTVKNKAFYL